MGFTTDGWLEGVQRVYPPAWKVNGWTNLGSGITCHSAEGYEHGLLSQLAVYSWTFTALKDGRRWQHYPITAQCWHSGNAYGNNNLVSIEFEGVAGQALTEAQIESAVYFIREVSTHRGWIPVRNPTFHNLYEHNELSGTSCPSGRIPWTEILHRLNTVVGADTMRRWVFNNNWILNETGGPSHLDWAPGLYTFDAQKDYSLPTPLPTDIVLATWLNKGHIQWLDGDGQLAGTVGWGGGLNNYGETRVKPNSLGQIKLQVLETTKFARNMVLGIMP